MQATLCLQDLVDGNSISQQPPLLCHCCLLDALHVRPELIQTWYCYDARRIHVRIKSIHGEGRWAVYDGIPGVKGAAHEQVYELISSTAHLQVHEEKKAAASGCAAGAAVALAVSLQQQLWLLVMQG